MLKVSNIGRAHILCAALLISLLISLLLACEAAVEPSALTPPTNAGGQANPVLPGLSAQGVELAREIGILSGLERLAQMHPTATSLESRYQFLLLKQEVIQAVLATDLAVRTVRSEIALEATQANELRAFLENRRNRAVAINSVANFLSGGVSEVVGGSFQLKPSLDSAGNIIETIGGGVQIGLSSLALKQQQGGKRDVQGDPNMLSKIFDLPADEDSDYPPVIWSYLNWARNVNAKASSTRRSELLQHWTKMGRINPRSSSYKRTLREITSSVPNHHPVTISVLDDRAAMLADVDATVGQMDRHLLELILYVNRFNLTLNDGPTLR